MRPETLVTSVDTGRPALRRLRLVINEREVDLESSLVIGSSREVDVTIDDKKVSRRHAMLQRVEDGVRVKDLGSKNGTFIGGVRVHDAVVIAGTVVTIGDTQVRVVAVDRPAPVEARSTFGELETKSDQMAALFGLLGRASQSEATLLLEGETGVGKDVLARTIHDVSPRADGPRIVFDCSAIPASLIASELFGHKKGAFTGALHDRAGVFEEANGGTVFLDEIGELPLDLQPMLLRALENREVRRVGEARARPINVRVVAATNRDLKKEVEAGTFREDLFFRLAVVRVTVPALRERKEDVELLAGVLLKQLGVTAPLSPSDSAVLKSYDWPGNVRELKNVLARSAALSPPDRFQLMPPASETTEPKKSAPPKDDDDDELKPYKEARTDLLRRFEEHYVHRLLDEHEGNIAAAARAAGIDRNYIYRLMKRYGIER